MIARLQGRKADKGAVAADTDGPYFLLSHKTLMTLLEPKQTRKDEMKSNPGGHHPGSCWKPEYSGMSVRHIELIDSSQHVSDQSSSIGLKGEIRPVLRGSCTATTRAYPMKVSTIESSGCLPCG